jgi:hypothetical protein
MKIGQLNFDFRSDAGTTEGRGRHKSDPRVPKAGAAKVRAKVRRHPRGATIQDEWFVRELISAIHRMWRNGGPDAPPRPEMIANGIRERSCRAAEQRRNSTGDRSRIS